MKIYLAGSIPKGDKEAASFVDWRLGYKPVLEQVLQAEFITPRAGEVDELDHLLVVGKDSTSIKNCDLVVVCAEEKLGAGTSIELAIAKYLKKPVVTILPKDSPHRKSNLKFDGQLVEDWIHPFIAVFSDFILDKIEDIINIKDQILKIKPKDITIVDEAINRFED